MIAPTNEAAAAATITVTVRDRAGEAPWGGSGFTGPCVRRVRIAANCPACGGPRGPRRNLNQCDDGAFYSTDIWDNPCGHLDRYASVVDEAELLALRGLAPGDRINLIDQRVPGQRIGVDVVSVDLQLRQVLMSNPSDPSDRAQFPLRRFDLSAREG